MQKSVGLRFVRLNPKIGWAGIRSTPVVLTVHEARANVTYRYRQRNHVKEIREKLIREIAIITTADTNQIDPTAPLHTLGMDSLKFVELLVAIERVFGVKLMETGMTRDDFFTVDALSRAISRHLS